MRLLENPQKRKTLGIHSGLGFLFGLFYTYNITYIFFSEIGNSTANFFYYLYGSKKIKNINCGTSNVYS